MPGAQSLGEDPDVVEAQIHPLGAGCRNDVGGASRQEQLTALHRLDDQAAHRCDAILNDLAGLKLRLSQPEAELTPDSVLGPVGHRLVGVDLGLDMADLQSAQSGKGENAGGGWVVKKNRGWTWYWPRTQPTETVADPPR